MAALSDTPVARMVELRHLRGGDLDTLLEEETEAWRETLDWDFRGSAGLVRRFLEMQALNGYALLINGYPVGYCYYVAEERKGLIGDLYVMKDYLSVENEERLLATVVEGLMKTPLHPAHRIAVDDAAHGSGDRCCRSGAIFARVRAQLHGNRERDGGAFARKASVAAGVVR